MAETINMPKLGFDMAEGTLIRWLKKVGELVKKGEVLAEIETDKATVEVESSATGTVRALLVDEGAIIPVNTPIAVIGSPDEKIDLPGLPGKEGKKEKKAETAAEPIIEKPSGSMKDIPDFGLERKASPLARNIAREKKIELSKILGSGPGGRIIRKDIEAALAGGTSLSGIESNITQESRIPVAATTNDQAVKFSKLRQAIGRRMTEAKTTIPHFYVTHGFKMDALMDLRSQMNKILPETEKISVNDFIIKACALSLHQYPNLNASLVGNGAVTHAQVNIGVAVSVEGGLLTVVCREADRKSLQQIAGEVKNMAGRARENKVRPEDIEGSTFSISNLGMYAVENFAAIINPPEAAILAVATVQEEAVVEGGAIKTGWRMKATISVDHRLSDGVEAAKFLQQLAVFLEEPLRLIL